MKRAAPMRGASIKQMRHTIDDLADLRTIELGVMTVDRHPTDLEALLDHAVRGLDLASQHRIEATSPVRLTVVADATRVVRVITRLLQIALSTSPAGSSVKVVLEHRGPHAVIGLCVAGTLAATTLRLVLDHPDESCRPRGERLGMLVARHALEAHGGSLTAFEECGGTRIELALPLQARPVRCALNTPKPSVLLVDDNLEQGIALVTLMQSDGFEAELTSTGAAAMQQIVARSFDVLVVDFRLPDMSSLEIIERARQHQRNLPAVLLSGFPRTHPPLAMALAATGGAHVDKPVSLATLYAELARAVERRH